jgi:Mg2+ and Co2+ transporter CorA
MKRQVEKLQDHARIVDEIADALLEGQVEMLQEIAELREINAELLDALESLLTQAQQ